MLKDTMPLSHQLTMPPHGPTVIPPTTKPYSLPLSREAFSTALRIGHGRAYEHAAAFGIDDRLDDVLYAMLYDPAWDPLLDHDRDEWIMSIVRAANAQDVLVRRFLELVNRPHGAWRAWAEHSHRNGIIALLGRDGHPGMADLLHDRLTILPDTDFVSGAEALMWLSGPMGLTRLVSTIAAWRAQDPEVPLFSWYMSSYDDGRDSSSKEAGHPAPHDTREARAILEDARSTDPGIDRWLTDLAAAGKDPWDEKEHPFDTMTEAEIMQWFGRNDPKTADDVIQRIDMIPDDASFRAMNEALSWCRVWASSASDEQLEAVTQAMSCAAESHAPPTRLRGYLKVFAWRPMPTVRPAIIELLNHPDTLVRSRAIQALRHVRAPQIRAHAVERLQQPSPDFNLIQLIKSSREPDDAAFLERLLVVTPDVEGMASLCDALRLVFDKDSITPNAAGLMRFVYEHAPSSLSRRHAYDVLETLGNLPEWIQSEVAHDAYEHLNRKARPGHADA
jgi:hypothetical protein